MATKNIILNRQIVPDDCVHVQDGAEIPRDVPVTLSLQRWESEGGSLATSQNVGVRLSGTDDPHVLAGSVDSLARIALEFPKFADGRCYSHARILREELGFKGELRAVGDVLRDQIFYLHRCGFNAFEVPAHRNIEDAAKGLTDFSVVYQPAADEPLPIFRRR